VDSMTSKIETENQYFRINTGNKQILLTACHRIPDRSIHIRGKPFLCYRCFGINLGFFISLIFQAGMLIIGLLDLIAISHPIISSTTPFIYKFGFTLILQIPFIVDGTIQLIYEKYESNNYLRLFSGVLGGIGQFYFVFTLGAFTKSILVF